MQNLKNTFHRSLWFFTMVGLLGFGCGQPTTDPTSPQKQNSGSEELSSQALQHALKEALLDEYKAKATYQKVINSFGSVKPFSNIVGAEVRHANAILGLYQKRQWTPPQNPWSIHSKSIPNFESLREACQAGVKGEIENAAIYERLLKLPLPEDIQKVFNQLKGASDDNHLQAFQQCAGD